jgi:hypothetical protein
MVGRPDLDFNLARGQRKALGRVVGCVQIQCHGLYPAVQIIKPVLSVLPRGALLIKGGAFSAKFTALFRECGELTLNQIDHVRVFYVGEALD